MNSQMSHFDKIKVFFNSTDKVIMNTFLYAIYNHEMILVKTFSLSKRSRRFTKNNPYRFYYKGYWVVDTQPEPKQESVVLKKVA